jgi:hypothetical protein
LYGLHDPRYLASKGQSRKFHYVHDDFLSSDADDLLCKARQIDMVSLSPYAAMADAQLQGITFPEYFARGTIPLPQLALFEKAWYLLLDTHTNRNGRPGHSCSVDEDTGEVIAPSESSENAPQSHESSSWYDLHPQGDFVTLDPEEELPF